MLKWTAWNRTVLTCKLRTNANWIVRNKIVFDIETILMLNWIVWIRTVLTFNCLWTKSILILNWLVWIRTVWLNWIAWNINVFNN